MTDQELIDRVSDDLDNIQALRRRIEEEGGLVQVDGEWRLNPTILEYSAAYDSLISALQSHPTPLPSVLQELLDSLLRILEDQNSIHGGIQ